jgi:hypothetical protein
MRSPSSASETVRRVHKEFVKRLKKDWDAFIESAGYLFFGRLSYDHVRLDDWRKYFTDVIPCSAAKGGWMYGMFGHPSGRVYATTDMGNFFRSDDGGKTFVAVGQNDYYKHVFHIAINPNNPDHIVIAASNGIFVSYDGGVTTQRGRLSVGKYLEHGALGDKGAFRGLRNAPESVRGGDQSAWEFAGWGPFDDYTNWTNDRWLGTANLSSNIQRLQAFGSIFSQDLFFSGYRTIHFAHRSLAGSPSNNLATPQRYMPAGRPSRFGNLWRDSVYFNSNSQMVYRNTSNQYQNSGNFDIPFGDQVDSNFAEGRVAYRRRGRPIPESTSNTNASNISDLIFTHNSLSRPFDNTFPDCSMFVRAAFAPSNPDIVYAISGYSARSFVEFGFGKYLGLSNINYSNVYIPADADPNRTLSDDKQWWSMSFIWVSFDGGESWSLLGHTVGMWRPPSNLPNWWKDLFQDYSSPPTFTNGGLPNVDKKLNTGSGPNNILSNPFWHLVNNALSEGNDLRMEFTWSDGQAKGNSYAPGIMMIDLAVDPNNPFVVMLSCNDMFASFTYGNKVSFDSYNPNALNHYPQRTLRPYWTGGLIRIEIKTVNLVDPQSSNLPITEVGTDTSNLGLLSRIYTEELCTINSDYTWYSSKARYITNLGTNRRPIEEDGWFGVKDLRDVIVENGVIEWKQKVYETNRTVGQTYLMRTVKRGYSQTAAMIAFDWTLNNSLTDSWASSTQEHFIHNGILALRWRPDGLWITQIPRWRLLKNASGNPATYKLSSTSKTYYLFECSPMIAKLNFDGKTLSSVTPIRSYHQETYRIRPNTSDWQNYLAAYEVNNPPDNTFTNAENAPHRAMKYLYAIIGISDSNHNQSLHTSESNYAAVVELPSYFANYWAWETFLSIEEARIQQNPSENRFVRYKNIFNSNISNYAGQNLGTNIPFYSLMPLNVNMIAFWVPNFIIFPICFILDDDYIFVGQTPRLHTDHLQQSYNNGNYNAAVVPARRSAPFLILNHSNPKGCFVAIESKAVANQSASDKNLNALVYLKDRLDPPFPSPVFHGNTNPSFYHNQFSQETYADMVNNYGAALIKKSPKKYVLIISQETIGFRYEIDFDQKTCSVNYLHSSPNTSYSKNSNYLLLSSLLSNTRTIFLVNYKKLNQLDNSYLDSMHSLITSNFNSQANSAVHIWEKCSGFEEAASQNTRWLKESNAIAYWDEHQCNAIVLAEGSAFYNFLFKKILTSFSFAKAFEFDKNVEGSNVSLSYGTFQSGLTVLGDDSEFVYYAFQYYLPKNQPAEGYFVGVLRISKDLLLRPESLGEWFDGIHALGFLKHDEGGWYWSREINRHIQILTPVGRIRRLDWAQSDPNAPHYLESANDMGPKDFDMGAASIMPCMIFGRNDSSYGRVYGQVVEDGDDTIIYLHVGSKLGGHAITQDQAQSMVAPTTNNYLLAQSNRKAFWVDSNNNPAYNQDYGQMYNPKIYRLKVSKSRVYSGWMYLLPPDANNRRYVQFDFANPFDGSLECLNDDTYYELTYHPDVLASETVGGVTRFYLDPSNPNHLNRWYDPDHANERWGYWYRHDDTNSANLRGIRNNGDTVFNIARFSKINTPRARLYTHVFAVNYKVNSSNNEPYPDFSDIKSGWVEWDVPGFLWDNLGDVTEAGRSFVVDPFNKGEKNRLLVSVQVAFPAGINANFTSNEPLGLYLRDTTYAVWCTVLFDVRREIVDGKPVWKWYALFPNGLLYFSAPFYKSGLPNLPSGTTRFRSNITLSPGEYADTVCYNWLEQNNFKVKVNPSHVNVGNGAVDLLGRYKTNNNSNYSAVSFVNSPYTYLPFASRYTSRSPCLAIGRTRDIETPAGTLKEADVYVTSSAKDPSLESLWMFHWDSFYVMPSPLAFRVMGNLNTNTDNNSIAERIRSLGEALFKTRDFKPNGYYHTLARHQSNHNVGTIRDMLNPVGAIIRFTIKDVPEYNLLGSSSPVSYIPIDPVNTPSSNRISILDDFKVVLENYAIFGWKGISVYYKNGVLFAAYPRREGNPNVLYQNHLFMSVNRGESWVAVKIPFISHGFEGIDVHPQTFDFIICGGAYPMVFRSVGYREFVRRLLTNSTGLDKLPLRRYELAGRKRL